MQRVTLVLSGRIDGRLLSTFSFEELQARVSRAVPDARWAYLGYQGNRFCLDSVVSEQKVAAVQAQAAKQTCIKKVLVEPWPARTPATTS